MNRSSKNLRFIRIFLNKNVSQLLKSFHFSVLKTNKQTKKPTGFTIMRDEGLPRYAKKNFDLPFSSIFAQECWFFRVFLLALVLLCLKSLPLHHWTITRKPCIMYLNCHNQFFFYYSGRTEGKNYNQTGQLSKLIIATLRKF